jgi:hypothetical protein
MRTLILADRKPDIELNQLLEENNFDLIILAGDLEEQDLQPIKNYPAYKIGVYGNHCREGYFERLNVQNLFGNIVTLTNGKTISGLQGCPRYKPIGNFIYSEEEFSHFVDYLPRVDLLVTHTPPLGINDEEGSPSHQGFACLLDYVEEKNPEFLIHGHTYPKTPVRIHGQTKIIYTSGHEIIDLF